MLNKGVKQELRMEEATVHDREVFRDLWYAMAYDK